MFAMTAAMMLHQEQAPNYHHNHDDAMVPFFNTSEQIDNISINKTPFHDSEKEDVSETITPTTSSDWSTEEEEYPSDDYDEKDETTIDDSDKINGTGLILYVTPTATKAAYWKRRLGWKPHTAKTLQKKVKKTLFRRPITNTIRKGRGFETQGADALVANQVFKSSDAGKRVTDSRELLLEHKTKDVDVLGAVVHHDFVFA